MVADVGILDRVGVGEQPGLECGALLGRGKRPRRHVMRPEAFDERLRFAQNFGETGGAARADEIVGILSRWQGRKGQAEARAEQRKRAHSGAHRRFLSRAVAVEAEHGHRHHPPQHPELVLGERGAERRDRVSDPRLGERDHVHITFDDDHPVRLARRGARLVEVEERAALVEERCVGRVQIFGLAVAQDAPAERDHAPARVADRDHQPAAEPVVGFLVVDGDQHAGFDQHRGREFLERLFQRAAAFGREAEAEGGARRVRNAALRQIIARGRAVAAAELLGEPFGGGLRHVAQARLLLGFLRGARVGGGDVHPGFAREFPDRVHEAEAALVGHPADRVAVRAAAEAMVKALFVVDREAGRLFVMERAAGLILAAGAGDLHRPPDQGRQRDARAQFVQPLRGEGHQSPSHLWEGLGEGMFPSTCSISATTPSVRSNTSLFQKRITRYPRDSR